MPSATLGAGGDTSVCTIWYMISFDKHIDAPPARVWELAGDLTRWGEYLRTVDSVDDLTGSGPGLEARFAVRQPGLPRTVYQVTDWRPGAGFAWVAASAVLTTTATHTLRADGEGTLLSLGIAWTGPLAWLARLLYQRKAAAYIRFEAHDFAALAERAQHG